MGEKAGRRRSGAWYVKQFLDYCRTHRGRADTTIYCYAKSYKAWLDLLAEQGTHLLDASVHQMRQFVTMPLKKGKRGVGSPPTDSSKKRRVSELRTLYKWLHAEGYIAANPAMRLEAPTPHNENPRPCPDEVWKALWASDLPDDERVAFGLAMFCGLRRHEVTGLQPGHFVDVPRPIIAGFRRKGGAKANLPWLSCVRFFVQRRPDLGAERLVEPLARMRQERASEPFLLPWKVTNGQIDPYTFNRRLRRACLRAGLAPDATTPHMLRHAFCTNLLDAGVPLLDVSRMANHSSVVVTQRYLKTREDPLAALLRDDADAEAALSSFARWTH